MRVPDSLVPLLEHGIIDEVIRPLLAGKEAQIYLVHSEGEERVAKVYKQANERTFKHRSDYTEGRRVRSSRDQRAMAKRSNYGRKKDEAAWRNTEVDVIYRLQAAGVRVPIPYHFIDGVLIMELVDNGRGEPAPRLADVLLPKDRAEEIFDHLLAEIVRMLCAGIVHGDLSEFNILMDSDGPVIIDFPQAMDPSSNQNAKRILLRDIENIKRFLGRKVRSRRNLPYGEELWDLYERGELKTDSKLTGAYTAKAGKADAHSLLEEIAFIEAEALKRRQDAGIEPRDSKPEFRIEITEEEIERSRQAQNQKKKRGRRGGKKPEGQGNREDRDSSGGGRNGQSRRRRGGGGGGANQATTAEGGGQNRGNGRSRNSGDVSQGNKNHANKTDASGKAPTRPKRSRRRRKPRAPAAE